jgi:hypothetical protein
MVQLVTEEDLKFSLERLRSNSYDSSAKVSDSLSKENFKIELETLEIAT